MKKVFQRGFTLIELLVVIAIIGILASVVLASLSTARQRGEVAAYQSEVQQAVNDVLLNCDAGQTNHSYPAGSKTAATTVTCTDFNGGTDTRIAPQDATLPECGSISINGASFTGAACVTNPAPSP